MRAMGRNPTEEELINIMNEIDVDHNGNNVNYLLHIHLKQNITDECTWWNEIVTIILLLGKLDFSEFTMMMREKLTVENVEEEIMLAFR